MSQSRTPAGAGSSLAARAVNPKAAVPILLGTFLFSLIIDNGFKFMTLPIAADLGLSENTASLQASLAGIIIGIGAVVYAALADSISIRKLMIVGIALMAVGSIIGFLFQSNWTLVLTGRIIQTAGLAAAETLYVIYVTTHLPAKDQKTYLGFSTACFQAAVLFGTLTSGFIATYISWTAMFLVALVAVLAIPVILRTVPPEEAVGGNMDVFGLFLITVVATCTMLFMQNFNLLYLLPIILGIIVFAWHIKTHTRTVVRPEFFANRRYVWALVVVLIVYSTNLGLSVIVVPGAVEHIHHGTLAQASLLIAPGYAVGTIVGILSGKIGRVLNSRHAILTALGLIIASLVLCALFIQTSVYVIVIAMMLFIGGFALMYAPLLNGAISNIPAAKTGIAIGFYNLTINIAVPLGIAYSAKLVDLNLGLFGGHGDAGAYTSVLWILTILSVIGAVIYGVTDSALTRQERGQRVK